MSQKICGDCYANAALVRTFRDQCVEGNRVILHLQKRRKDANNILDDQCEQEKDLMLTNERVIECNSYVVYEEEEVEDTDSAELNITTIYVNRESKQDNIEHEFNVLVEEPTDLIMDLRGSREEIGNKNCQDKEVESSTGQTYNMIKYDEMVKDEEVQSTIGEDLKVHATVTDDLAAIAKAIEKITTTMKYELAKHTPVPPNPLLCHLCVSNRSVDLLYKDKMDLEAHQRLQHTDSLNLFKCLLCKTYFDNRDRCLKHFTMHDKKGEVCPICGRFYGHLIMHLNSTHNKHDFTCEICGLVMRNTSKVRFEHHQKWHDPEKQLKCPHDGCNRTFLQKPHLKIHVSTHSKISDYHCDECEKNFSTPLTLKEHFIRKHGVQSDIKCKICYETFLSTKERNIHVKNVHPEQYTEKCDICNNFFQNVSSLRNHIRVVHAVSNKKGPQIRLGRDRKGRTMHGFHRCNLCQQQFHSESTLKVHQNKHSSVGRPFSCSDCPNFYKTAGNLRSHQQVCHMPDTDMLHKCEFCEKRFSALYELNSHLLSHNTEKFNCDQCKGIFATERYLKKHQMAKHSFEHKHKCDYCEMKFLDRPRVIAHMKKEHDDLYFKNLY